MATLKDISKLTGISVTQVSRALGGFDDVNEKTRNLVLSAARDLGYQPNAMARGLKTGRTGIVALILPEDIDASAQEILFEMVHGLSMEFAKASLKLVLHVGADGGPQIYRDLLNWGGVDGFILLDPKLNDPRIAMLSERGVPFVVHGRDPEQQHRYVDVDNTQIGKDLAQRVLEHGHCRAAFLNGPEDRTFATLRSAGVQGCFAKVGATVDISYGPMTVDRGYAEAMSILKGSNPPSAIIAGNVMIARGVYDAAHEIGLNLPDDLLVLAHDDGLKRYPASSFNPPLMGTYSGLTEAWQALSQDMAEAIKSTSDSISCTVLKSRTVD